MLNSAQAFDKFLKEFVEPSGKQAEDATRQEKAVREALQKALGPREVFISGSYGRGTAIRPLHDIDLFFVLPPDPGPPSVQAYLQKFKKAIEDAFPGKHARLQAHSVNIEFTGSEIGFDVLPALSPERRTDARQKLESAAGKARQALEYEKHGNLKEAHSLWRDLLGTDFPEW